MCDENEDDHLTDMFNDVEDCFIDRPDCFMKLSFVVRMYNLKAHNEWSDNGLLSLLGNVLPKDNNIPNSMYEAKKILWALGIEHERIHIFPNDCILYWKEFMDASKCPICET